MGANITVSAYGSDILTIDTPLEAPYYDEFTGTSAAIPQVAAVIALMIARAQEMELDMNWRDITNIFAHTALKYDPLDPSWETHLADLDVSHHYGFGVVDAKAAVTAVNASDYFISAEPWNQGTAEGSVLNTAYRFTDSTGIVDWIKVTVDMAADIEHRDLNIIVRHTDEEDHHHSNYIF